nr:MAG TPA: hypothetical protein [Caudoviricetes sp.]
MKYTSRNDIKKPNSILAKNSTIGQSRSIIKK